MPIARTRKTRTASFAAIFLATLSLAACGAKSGGEDDNANENTPAVPEVTVVRVARGNISSNLTVTGTLAALPNRDVRVSPLVAGRIAEMIVAEGDHVRQGQELAKIEPGPWQDQLRQAEASVEQARANMENARLNRDRNENLFSRGIAARKDLEDARTQLSVSEAALKQAEAALELARLQLTRTDIRAPLDGVVVKRFASVGEQVDGTAAQPVFEVADIRTVELFGNVPATYLARVHVGQVVAVSTEALPGQSFEGRIVAVSPAVDPSTNLGLVRIRIRNPSGALRLGIFLTAQLPLETHTNTLMVPTEAVYRNEAGEPRVYRLKGETVEAVAVKLGLEAGGRTEILSGPQEGEAIVDTGGYGLKDQAHVRIHQP